MQHGRKIHQCWSPIQLLVHSTMHRDTTDGHRFTQTNRQTDRRRTQLTNNDIVTSIYTIRIFGIISPSN